MDTEVDDESPTSKLKGGVEAKQLVSHKIAVIMTLEFTIYMTKFKMRIFTHRNKMLAITQH